jgi:putative transcriptional regulator
VIGLLSNVVGLLPSRAAGKGAEAVYNRIAMPRAERQVSRRELADALGVHYRTVGYLERGECSPSLFP